MGNSTGSMLWMAGVFLAVYIVGMLLWQGCWLIRRIWETKKYRHGKKEESS